MSGQASGFIKDWQVLAQQSWDTWLRQLQPAPAASPVGDATLERTLSGLKGCFDWMQGVAAAGASQPDADWQTLLRAWAGAGNQPFTQAFNGIDNAAAQGFVQQWQNWLQTAQAGNFGVPGAAAGAGGAMPAFGLQREQWMQQQELLAAFQDTVQANARYQALIQRANTQGLERLQARLAERSASNPPIESLKALYDLWVDAAEEAYAEVALTDEFRAAYGAMVNSQMRVRQLQQQQLGQLCRELGLPTREEVSTLGERLQQLRREMRQQGHHDAAAEILALRREVTALRRELTAMSGKPAAKPATKSAAESATRSTTKSTVRRAAPAAQPAKAATKSRKR